MDKRLAPVAFSAPAQFATAQDGTRRFSGVAYGGGVITDHPLFDRVAFDLSSTKFKTPAPVLFDHKEPIGVADKVTLDGQILLEGKLFSDLQGASKNVTDMADRGMPWQLSIGVFPGKIDQIPEGRSIRLNGHNVAGPLAVFRNNRIRETSFVPLGADDQTNASVFTIGGDAPRTGAHMAEFSQQDIDNAVKAERDRADAEKIRADKATADLAAAQTQFTALQTATLERRNAERTAKLKAHFTILPKDFKEEHWKPYLDMSDAQWTLVTEQFAARPALDPNLAKEHATDGGTGDDGVLDTTPKIVAAAQKFIADQKVLGNEVDVAAAVSHVTFAAKKAA